MASDDDPRTDAQLIAAINVGNEAAFTTLYYRYRDWSASLALRFTANRDDALDAVQDAFIYLSGRFSGVCPDQQVHHVFLCGHQKHRVGHRAEAAPHHQ